MNPLLLARFAQTAAAVVLTGTLGLRLLAWKTDAREALRWNGLAWGSWGLLVLAGGGVLGFTAAAMTGQTLVETLRGGAVGDVLTGTRFGAVWRVRAGLSAGVCVVNLFVGRHRRPRPSVALDAVNLLLAAAALATLVWTGHAQAAARAAWLLPSDIAHALAAGAWPGGLLPLAILLARTRRQPTLLRTAVAVTRRFSWLSTVAVAVLALSGSLDAWAMVGTFAALASSPYGRLLSCKVALFLVMVGLGFMNRRMIARESPEDTWRRLCLNVGWECVLAAGVLLATEALAASAPPHGSAL